MNISSEEDLVQPSMAIITAAGDGRRLVFKAADAMAEGDYDLAVSLVDQGQARLRDAHRVHTDCIQAAAVQSVPYSLLFTHAEDTLMTANSELRLVKRLMTVFQSLDERLRAVEARTPQEIPA